MPFSGLQKVTADQLNRLQPITDSAEATSTLDVTTSVADVPGALVSIDTTTNGAAYVVEGSFDVVQDGAAGNTFFGRLYVDGADVGKIAPYRGQTASDRSLVQQTWRGTLPSAGSHTFQLRANSDASAKYNVNATQSGLVVTVYEVV
ncbi:hypothetical protein ABGB07_02365 [Micromonosporaceae bacterium B7E4]